MSPEDKRRLVVYSAAVFSLVLLFFVLSYIPAYLYIIAISVVSCAVYFNKSEEFQIFARLGLNPRRGLGLPPGMLRWFPGNTARNRTSKSDGKNSCVSLGDRHFGDSCRRREPSHGDSLFSPRDLLMGSYFSKTEERPSAFAGGVHPRDQLREKLARPNHAFHTPIRRLSFGDPLGSPGRFTITPHRHYPIQQTGAFPIGLMPSPKWGEFQKKKILVRRNSPALSPVTVKIARPEHTRSPLVNILSSPAAVISPDVGAQPDPCSREAVLSALRKREVDDEEQSAVSGHNSKRRRRDSSESFQSAFEPVLANGVTSQIVPKPGSLKRWINSGEESTVKRSRTSSVSSASDAPLPRGISFSSGRNPIHSSYSSSKSHPQKRAASNLTFSPLASPVGSRCPTPERTAKKARKDEAALPSFFAVTKTDEVVDLTSGSAKLTPKSEVPLVTSKSDSGGSRKRKIQLVPRDRVDLDLPPAPELGYIITVEDLNNETKAALERIQKVFKEPETEIPVSEHAPALAPPLLLFSQPDASSPSDTVAAVTSTVPALTTFCTPVQETTAATASASPSVDLTIPAPEVTASVASPAPAPPAINKPLLIPPALTSTTTAASVASVSSLFTTVSTSSVSGALMSESQPLTCIASPAVLPSTFAQILAQPLQTPSGGSLFNLLKPVAASAPEPPKFTSAHSISNPLLSAFKPIFEAAPTPASSAEVIPTQPKFKPLFESTTASAVSAFGQTSASSASTAAASTTLSSSLSFGGIMSSTQSSVMSASTTPATQASSKNPFGSWATSTTTTSAPSISSFQFAGTGTASSTAAPVLNTNFTSSAFPFDPAKPAPEAPQSTFSFSQPSSNQNTAPSTLFGGFEMTNSAIKTSDAPTTQATFRSSTFTSSSSSSSSAAASSSFPVAAPQTQPFTFGGSSGAAPASFTFGPGTSTAAPAFGTNSQASFGGSTAELSFGISTAAPANPAASNSTSSSTSGGYNFSASLSSNPFGSSAPAAQTPNFSFGSGNTEHKSTFGTSTPTFGQSSAVSFGSPAAPGFAGLGASPFGASPTTFSIGTGSKPSGPRRLQARRQHPRKK